MRVAILSDIHANAEALRPTLEEARREGAERLMLLGDYVGYHFDARQTFELLAPWPADGICGNHDRILLEARHGADLADYRANYGPALDRALGELPAEAFDWLASLPETLEVALGGQRLFLCHGSPFDPDAYIYWNSSPELIARCTAIGADGVLMGHTHHPFHRPGRPWLLNPGSVGQPRDIGGFASWCLFDVERGTIAMRRTAYDVVPVLERLRHEWPESKRQQKTVVRRNPVLAAAAGAGE
jgi:putative phosphoesterase